MSKLKQCETKRLHYNKYLYKLALANPFAPWFRTEFQKDGSLKKIKSKLDDYQTLYDIGKPMYRTVYRSELPITNEEFLDAKDLYSLLLNTDDYRIRVERWSGFCIYSNDKRFLLDLANKMRVSAREFWEPDLKNIKFLLDSKNTVIVNTPPQFPLKVTFNYKKINPEFAKWLENNTDKSSAGEKTVNNISTGWASGNYVFLRDDRVLTMVQLIVGHNIQRVEQLVYRGDIDK
jgi:hypothetical protein